MAGITLLEGGGEYQKNRSIGKVGTLSTLKIKVYPSSKGIPKYQSEKEEGPKVPPLGGEEGGRWFHSLQRASSKGWLLGRWSLPKVRFGPLPIKKNVAAECKEVIGT